MEYYAFVDGVYEYLSTRQIYDLNQEEVVWSGRLGTGLLGTIDCPTGNNGPKNRDEVLFGIGRTGLEKLINLGFIPCEVCVPEEIPEFLDGSRYAALMKYGLDNPFSLADKELFPYDARRLEWNELLRDLFVVPSRLYVPQGLSDEDVKAARLVFTSVVSHAPAIGFYDRSVDSRFTEYDISARMRNG